MNLKHLLTLSTVFYLGSPLLFAQTPAFNCGSNGSYGPMNITVSTTLQLPPDGIFHCTTVNVAQGASLSFLRNAVNTPVYILATGDVTISGSCDINGSGATGVAGGVGGPGGFDGGTASNSQTIPAGAGGGPGGGRRGNFSLVVGGGPGSYRVLSSVGGGGEIYGSRLLLPLVGGSGGGGGHGQNVSVFGGGGGGGAILIASNTRVVFGNMSSIQADGGNPRGPVFGEHTQGVPSGMGSGGAIRIVAPSIEGVAKLRAAAAHGNHGRIRLDTFDYSSLSYGTEGSGYVPDSIGSVMVVFPTPLPKLSVSNAAGTAIAENATGPVSVILSAGTNPSQTIQVRARDFGGVVPIRVRLVPESGDATTFDGTINNTVTNPATTTVPVTMPINTGVRVEVFTR